MKISNRPGRLFALFIFSPILIFCSYTIKKDYSRISLILLILGVLLFFYELYWVLFRPDEFSLKS